MHTLACLSMYKFTHHLEQDDSSTGRIRLQSLQQYPDAIYDQEWRWQVSVHEIPHPML